MKVNCHNSRTSDDTLMKLGTLTKLNKRNETMSKEIDDDVMLAKTALLFSYLQPI